MARNANLASVLRVVLRESTPPSRADVAARLGLTRSTVSRLVDELIDGGLVLELDPVSGRRGRPAVPLVPASEGLVAIGLEANVERLVTTVVGVSGDVVKQSVEELDVGGLGPKKALARLAQQALGVIDDLPAASRVVGVHLSVPGLVDRAGQVVLRAPNLGWDGVRPGEHLGALLDGLGDVDFRVGNDIDASALTVIHESRADGDRSFLYLTGEVGIGSAIVSAGQLMVGVHGWASELGHFCVDPRGDECGCGSRGCLETVVGRRSLLSAAGASTPAGLVEALAAGEAQAARAIDRAVQALGIAIGGALNLLDIETVAFGGHLAELEEWLFPGLAEELQRRVLWSPYSEISLEVVAEAPRRAAVGAALAALATITADPADWLDRQPQE